VSTTQIVFVAGSAQVIVQVDPLWPTCSPEQPALASHELPGLRRPDTLSDARPVEAVRSRSRTGEWS
jgi:hypothetical protein